DGLHAPNHFKLVRKIMEERPIYRQVLAQLNIRELPDMVENLLNKEFDGLFSERRKEFIMGCIRLRLDYYVKAVTI
ncbi:MAG TPA: hypothetical protein VIK28_06375, partial [Sedimentisphaerales bacterium]